MPMFILINGVRWILMPFVVCLLVMGQIKNDKNVHHPSTPKLLVIMDVIFHEDLSYFIAHTCPSLQGERGSEEKNLCFEEDKEKLWQSIDQHVPVDWSSLNREDPDEDLVPEVTHDVSEGQWKIQPLMPYHFLNRLVMKKLSR
ncbi:hypothetical protein ACE6H2_003308 [Prunus campanulata]